MHTTYTIIIIVLHFPQNYSNQKSNLSTFKEYRPKSCTFNGLICTYIKVKHFHGFQAAWQQVCFSVKNSQSCLRTGIGHAKTTMRRWGYIDNTQSVICDSGEPQTVSISSAAGYLMSLAQDCRLGKAHQLADFAPRPHMNMNQQKKSKLKELPEHKNHHLPCIIQIILKNSSF